MTENYKLRTLLANRLEITELKKLCFDLDIDFESVVGSGKDDKLIGILRYLENRNRLDDLVQWIKLERNDIYIDHYSDKKRQYTPNEDVNQNLDTVSRFPRQSKRSTYIPPKDGNIEKGRHSFALISDIGADFSILMQLLSKYNWKDANIETTRLLIEVLGRSKLGPLDARPNHVGMLGDRDIANLPCADLITIDNLWKHYSNGHFGYSIQAQIFEGKDFEDFLISVGWKSRREIIYDLSAPLGHLPIDPPHFAMGIFWNIATLIPRFQYCSYLT